MQPPLYSTPCLTHQEPGNVESLIKDIIIVFFSQMCKHLYNLYGQSIGRLVCDFSRFSLRTVRERQHYSSNLVWFHISVHHSQSSLLVQSLCQGKPVLPVEYMDHWVALICQFGCQCSNRFMAQWPILVAGSLNRRCYCWGQWHRSPWMMIVAMWRDCGVGRS